MSTTKVGRSGETSTVRSDASTIVATTAHAMALAIATDAMVVRINRDVIK
jgi:hypothetical protein